MGALGLVVLGGLALLNIPVTVSRAALYPGVTIEVQYGGVSPEKIEEIITRPVEEAVATIGAITEIRSESEEGKSRVHVRFEPSANADFKTLEIRERLDLVASQFPREVQKPAILKYDPDQRPVMILLLRSDSRTLQDLRDLADRELKQLFEGVPGVSQVFVAGGRSREILVDCDRQKLEAYGLTMRDLLNSLQAANQSEGLGHVQDGARRVRATARGRFESIDDIRKTRLKATDRALVHLEDVAGVQFAYQEQSSASRSNGTESITLYIYKAGTGDLLAVSAGVRKLVDIFPRKDIQFDVIQDTASVFRSTLRSIATLLVSGFAFVFLFGPRQYRFKVRTAGIGLAAFLSLLAAVLGLYLAKMQLDLLAIGAQFSLSWVLLSLAPDARKGMRAPGSTAANSLLYCGLLLSFVLPLVFAGPDFRRIYGGVALFTLICLPVGLVLLLGLPPLAQHPRARLIQLRLDGLHDQFNASMAAIWKRVDARLSTARLRRRLLPRMRGRLLRIWTQHPLKASMLVGCLTLGGLIGFKNADTALTAGLEATEIQARVEMPSGTSFEETDRIAREVEKRLAGIEQIASTTTRVDPAQAILTLKLRSQGDLSEAFLSRLKQATSGLEPAFVHFAAESSGGLLEDLAIDVMGDDLETLDKTVRELASRARSIPGAGDVLLRYKPPRPEVLLRIDKIKAEQSGLSTQDIGENVRYAIQGGVATKYYASAREMDIRIRYHEGSRTTRTDLEQITIRRPDGRYVPLKEIARQQDSTMPVKIYRTNKKRTFGFSMQPKEISADRLADRLGFLEEIALPEGYRIEFGQDLKARRERQAKLVSIGVAVLLMVFMVTASWDESLRKPIRSLKWMPVVLSLPGIMLWVGSAMLTVPVLVAWLLTAGIVLLRIREQGSRSRIARILRDDARLTFAFFLPALLLPGEGRAVLGTGALGCVLISVWSALLLPLMWRASPLPALKSFFIGLPGMRRGRAEVP